MKETNMQAVKETAKMLFLAVDIEPNPQFPFITSHPFTQVTTTCIEVNGKMEMVDLTNEDNYEMWKDQLFAQIDRAEDFGRIAMMTNTPWKLTLLKYCKDYLDNKTFTEYFAEFWVMSENPNMDVNVSIKEFISWYKEADKEILMDKEDYEVWKSLPEEFTVYRGVSNGRAEYGLSWTRNYDTAEWFANRFGEGHVLSATINKKHALAYLNSRGEDEIVVDVLAIKSKIKTE